MLKEQLTLAWNFYHLSLYKNCLEFVDLGMDKTLSKPMHIMKSDMFHFEKH